MANQVSTNLSAFVEPEIGVVPEHLLDLLGQWTPSLQRGSEQLRSMRISLINLEPSCLTWIVAD